MQIIVFRLSDLYFGLSTEYIEEITNTIPATIVPKSPDWIQGLVNLRGNVLTLVNMHNLLKIDDKNKDDCYTNTVVVQLSENTLALMVDEVVGVADVDESEFKPISEQENSSVQALITVYDQIVNLLNINSLFEEKEG